MVDRSQPLAPTVGVFGVMTLALVLALTLGTVATLFVVAGPSGPFLPSDWAALRFTLLQATVSAALSVALAIPLARALSRRRFVGRRLLLIMLGAPFILPAIVAVLGLLAIWGRSGFVSDILGWVGLPSISIFGFTGVIMAHVFFNLPLATRLFLQGWDAVPPEQFRTAAQLGFSPRNYRRHIEMPIIRTTAPGAFLVIFLLCLTSFAVVLTIGGGPRATTLELAIYQALRFDFDLGKAAKLATVQFGICAIATAFAFRLTSRTDTGFSLSRSQRRWDGGGTPSRIADGAIIGLAGLFLLTPILAIALRGVSNIATLPTEVFRASVTSVVISVTAAILVIGLALPLCLLIQRLPHRRAFAVSAEAVGYLPLAASPLVIGTGLFVIINPIANPFELALPVIVAVNAAMSLPFVVRIILPAVLDTERAFGRLADQLALSGWSRFKVVTWSGIRRPAGFAAGLTAALSMGDLGVVALFAPPDFQTLPLAMYRLMAAYRMDDAAAAAVVLVAVSVALLWAFDRGGRLGYHS